MGNSVFRYFLEWLKNELHEEAYTRLLKSFDKRESIYRRPKKEESTAFVNPGIVSTAKTILQTYFTGEENQQNNVQAGNVFEDFRQWQKSNDGKKHPQLWELAQAEGDEAWLDWIHDHIWTYIGLSAPLLGAINPVRAVVSGENMGTFILVPLIIHRTIDMQMFIHCCFRSLFRYANDRLRCKNNGIM